MKNVRITICLVVVCVMAGANIASADTFGSGTLNEFTIDFVPIGNAGNPGDVRTGTDERGWPLANPYGCGAVSYEYRIGEFEVTNTQWNAFTAAVGAPTGNFDGYGPGYNSIAKFTGAQQPTNNVSWYEALQFCNYLTSSDKSKGVYQFSGDNVNPGDFLGIDRNAAKATYGTIYFLPTENEWYKAAYYKPDGSGYSLYANGTNTVPETNQSLYGQSYPYAGPWDVGTGTQEQNGTFDMMGNVWEWNETFIVFDSGPERGLRGGSFLNPSHNLASSIGNNYPQHAEDINVGFRVASVPEPATVLLLSLGAVMLRRKH